MLENLADLHYSCIYEQGERSEICLKYSQNWVAPALAICACLGSSQMAEAAPLLQYGDTGKAVVSLQDQLKQAGCLPPENPSNGDYNNATYAAVTRFQQQNDLRVDGIVGNQTHAALGENRTCAASGAGLKLGSQGEEVRLMQIQLNNWGFPINGSRLEATGVFDEPTQTALQEFEEYFGQQFQDGIFDSQDSKILWASKEKALASKGKELAKRLTKDDTGQAANALEMMGSSVVPYLIPLLKSDNKDDRFAAALALSKIKTNAKDAVPELIRLLKSEDADDRFMAAGTLGTIGGEAKAAVPSLIRLLESEDKDERSIAADALGTIGATKEAVPPLIRLLTDNRLASRPDKNLSVSYFAAKALQGIGQEAQTAIPTLVDQLKHQDYQDDKDYRDSIAEALTKIVPSETTVLLQALASNDQRVRRGTAFAIGAKEQFFQEPVADQTLVGNKLREVVQNRNEDLEVRKTAAITLMLLNNQIELEESIRQFYTENQLTSLAEVWKKCPRRINVERWEFYFSAVTRKCEQLEGKGDGIPSWGEWRKAKSAPSPPPPPPPPKKG